MIEIRDKNCKKCAKFSHCNNNDLVCIKKFQQLKAKLIEINEIAHWRMGDADIHLHNRLEKIQKIIIINGE